MASVHEDFEVAKRRKEDLIRRFWEARERRDGAEMLPLLADQVSTQLHSKEVPEYADDEMSTQSRADYVREYATEGGSSPAPRSTLLDVTAFGDSVRAVGSEPFQVQGVEISSERFEVFSLASGQIHRVDTFLSGDECEEFLRPFADGERIDYVLQEWSGHPVGCLMSWNLEAFGLDDPHLRPVAEVRGYLVRLSGNRLGFMQKPSGEEDDHASAIVLLPETLQDLGMREDGTIVAIQGPIQYEFSRLDPGGWRMDGAGFLNALFTSAKGSAAELGGRAATAWKGRRRRHFGSAA